VEEDKSRLLQWPEVHSRVSFCRKTIDRWERNGKFPKRIRLGATAVAWVEAEIDEWFARLIELRKWSRPGSNGQPTASKADALSS
jgi:prophage regulatory protein